MSALAAWQRAFMEALEDEHEGTASDAPLGFHRASVRARRRDALAATYPIVARLLGRGPFDALAARYARAHPSHSANLDLYGDLFAAFLARQSEADATPCLPDVARLEWACHESFRAADAPALEAAALAAVPSELQGRVRLVLHPSVRVLESAYPIAAMREARAGCDRGALHAAAGGERVLVHRAGGEVRVRALSDFECRLLRALLRGAALEEVAAALGDEAAASLAPALARLVLEQAIAAFTVAADRA